MPLPSPSSANDPTLVALGEAIRRARIERGVSQERLALISEIDRSYVGAIERGKQNIGFLHLVRLAHALEMTVTELMMEAAI